MNEVHEPAGWQHRWADRENNRRRRAYAEDQARWRTDEAELRAMRDTARSPQAIPHDRVIAPIRLRRDETVLWQTARAGLVESPPDTAVRDSGYTGFSLSTVRIAGAAAPPVADHGVVIVTDRRVVFRGERRNREWAYHQVTRFLHEANRPTTLIHVSNRKRTSGVVPYDADVAGFRFAFTLGTSMSIGQREGFAAHLEALLAGLHAEAPVPPPIAQPHEAPYGFWRTIYTGRPSMPGWLRVTQGALAAAVTLFLAVSAFGLLEPSGPVTPVAETSRSPHVAAPTKTASPTPTAVLSPAASPTPHASPSMRPSPKPKPKPSPKPTPRKTHRPSPKPKALCGAPANPYGYTFCGGSRIYDPKPGTCDYFSCIDYFDNGNGYMIQCRDGTYSLSGGRRGACSHHDGVRRPVYR